MTFTTIHDDNPDWLNRVLLRKKECDLGVPFYDNSAPGHHGIAAAEWASRPPGVPQRPTTLEGWRADQRALTDFMNDLTAGKVAIAPRGPFIQPINILLGDFLGESGVIRNDSVVVTHGVRVEVFAPVLIPPPFDFILSASGDSWDWYTPGVIAPYGLGYQSEWSLPRTPDEIIDMESIGVDTTLLDWWTPVARSTSTDLDPRNHLPKDGQVNHFRVLEFMDWINEVTWAHEWRKHDVRDASNNPVTPQPSRPRSRAV